MGATLSVLGLYNYDNTIFDGMMLPDGVSREDAVSSILIECAELEILFPDPEFLKKTIALWARSRLSQWNKLYQTTIVEYDPIENYNRVESWTDETQSNGSNSNTKQMTGNDSQSTQLSGTTSSTDNGTDTMYVVGFNGAAGGGLGESLKDKQTSVSEHTANTTGSNTGSTTINHEETDNGSTTSSSSNTRQGYAKGNIGVTTTQQMLEEERRVAVFNLIDYIVRDFKRRFCILVY